MQMQVDIGISEADRKGISEGLSRVLADSYTLYLKTHNFHWNATGPMFQTLHTMFETQYINLRDAVDEIAERIRALGFFAPGSYKQYAELTGIEEETGNPQAKEMIQQLTSANEQVAKSCRDVFPAAEKGSDEATMDLLTQRIQYHEKTAWMLRSLLSE